MTDETAPTENAENETSETAAAPALTKAGIIGRKVGMLQHFRPDGSVVGATVIATESNLITRVATKERDGYTALPPLETFGPMYARDAAAALELAREHAWLMASEIRASGVDLSFAPVVDLGRGNRAIGDRAFSPDPQVVAAFTRAYVEGMHSAGMGATQDGRDFFRRRHRLRRAAGRDRDGHARRQRLAHRHAHHPDRPGRGSALRHPRRRQDRGRRRGDEDPGVGAKWRKTTDRS